MLNDKKEVKKPKGKRGDLTGRIHWKLQVLSVASVLEDTWNVYCECGSKTVLTRKAFFSSRSCGCHRKELGGRVYVKDMLPYIPIIPLTSKQNEAYKIWSGMWDRCTNPKGFMYPAYGGRGIKVCERWKSFFAFWVDMGPRPGIEFSIERQDVNKGYEPSNCIWLLKTLQSRNTRKTIRVIVNGKKMPLVEFLEQNPEFTRKDFPSKEVRKNPDISDFVNKHYGIGYTTDSEDIIKALDQWLDTKLREKE